jgi:hypothetical protein
VYFVTASLTAEVDLSASGDRFPYKTFKLLPQVPGERKENFLKLHEALYGNDPRRKM